MAKTFCWACRQHVEIGTRAIDCETCEGSVTTVKDHPEHTELRKKVITNLRRQYTNAVKAAEQASAARRKLEPGSTRARVTTANARWMSAAENRDRIAAKLLDWGETVDGYVATQTETCSSHG